MPVYCNKSISKGKRGNVVKAELLQSAVTTDKDGVKKYISEIEGATIMTMERSAGGSEPAPAQSSGSSDYRPASA